MRGGVHDPAVVELFVERQLADRVDLHPCRTRKFKALPGRAVVLGDDGGDCRRGVDGTRGRDLLWRRDTGLTTSADRQSELPVQAVLDIRAAVLRAPAESNEVADTEIEIAVEGNRGRLIGGVVRFVGAGRQVHSAGEAPQSIRFAPRLGGSQVPHDRAGPHVENPGSRRPGGLFVVLPLPLIRLAQPVGPGLRADGRDLDVLRHRQHEAAGAVFARREIVDIDQNGSGALRLGP